VPFSPPGVPSFHSHNRTQGVTDIVWCLRMLADGLLLVIPQEKHGDYGCGTDLTSVYPVRFSLITRAFTHAAYAVIKFVAMRPCSTDGPKSSQLSESVLYELTAYRVARDRAPEYVISTSAACSLNLLRKTPVYSVGQIQLTEMPCR
jgi:hypothetical protein